MDIFCTLDNLESSPITVDDYEQRTGKRFPYYQIGADGKKRHYAVCPECGNPTIIVNLYGVSKAEDLTERRTLHARHSMGTVQGLPAYDLERYLECSLGNKQALGMHSAERNDADARAFRDYIIKHKKAIKSKIQTIIGFNLSQSLFDNKLFDPFIKSGEYCFTSVHRQNIPYAILYFAPEFNLYGQHLNRVSPVSAAWEIELQKHELVRSDEERISRSHDTSYISVKLCAKQFRENARTGIPTMKLELSIQGKIICKTIECPSIILE